jgi:methylenetetrahydrofolate dehydrogenase (NADP+)/methenyltetrahydrofolate cyclohydrolase
MIRIDGRKINTKVGENLKNEIGKRNIVPSLGILFVGTDAASDSFTKVKKRFGEKYGFQVNILNLAEEVGVDEIKSQLKKLQDENDSVIVQLPLPGKYKEHTCEILNEIKKEKDVDNLNDGDFEAPIVLALQKVFADIELVDLDTNFKKQKIGIVGLGQVVGLPIKNFLEKSGYRVEIIKKGEFLKLESCDTVISGIGQAHYIKKEFLKSGCILVDYGCSFISTDGSNGVAGDFDPECYEICKYYTPVPGCMGPLVVASLFENVFRAKIG